MSPAPLRYEFTGHVSRAAMLRSPTIAQGRPGVAIALDGIRHDSGVVRFWLHVTCGLPNDYMTSFQRPDRALVVVLRDGATHRSATFRLIDPNVNELHEIERNFVDRRSPDGSIIFATTHINAPLEVALDAHDGHPGLFVHVALHAHLSTVLRVPASPPQVSP